MMFMLSLFRNQKPLLSLSCTTAVEYANKSMRMSEGAIIFCILHECDERGREGQVSNCPYKVYQIPKLGIMDMSPGKYSVTN